MKETGKFSACLALEPVFLHASFLHNVILKGYFFEEVGIFQTRAPFTQEEQEALRGLLRQAAEEGKEQTLRREEAASLFSKYNRVNEAAQRTKSLDFIGFYSGGLNLKSEFSPLDRRSRRLLTRTFMVDSELKK